MLLSHFREGKAEAQRSTTGSPETTGPELALEPGPASPPPPGLPVTVTWGPTQALLTPSVTEGNQISLGSPTAEAEGCPTAP